MRENLFRGKTLPKCIGWDDEKEEEIYSESKWIYGGYGKIYGSSYIMTQPFMKHITAGGSRWMDEEIEAIRVQPETVGQDTGLKDKEGNRIFEGDILEASHDGNHYCVYYDESEAAYRLRYFAGVVRGIYYNFVVIGNIHDNPALLKEE